MKALSTSARVRAREIVERFVNGLAGKTEQAAKEVTAFIDEFPEELELLIEESRGLLNRQIISRFEKIGRGPRFFSEHYSQQKKST